MVAVIAQWRPLGLCAGILFHANSSAIPSNGALHGRSVLYVLLASIHSAFVHAYKNNVN